MHRDVLQPCYNNFYQMDGKQFELSQLVGKPLHRRMFCWLFESSESSPRTAAAGIWRNQSQNTRVRGGDDQRRGSNQNAATELIGYEWIIVSSTLMIIASSPLRDFEEEFDSRGQKGRIDPTECSYILRSWSTFEGITSALAGGPLSLATSSLDK